MASSTSTTTPPNEAYLQEYSGHILIAVSVALMVLEILCVGLHFVARRLSMTATGLDDWLIGPSFVFCFGLTVISVCAVRYSGAGRHAAFWQEVDPGKLVLWAKTLMIIELFYTTAFTLPRLSILALYLRIFTMRIHRLAVYILALIMVIFYITTVFLSFLKCHPLAYTWDLSVPGGHCINIDELYRWINMPNILIDIVILVLPFPVIWRLHVSKAQKFGLTMTFLTGSIGLIASIVRFAIFRSESLKDGTYHTELLIWTVVEPGFYLMAACFPAYRSLVPRLLQFIPSSPFLSRSSKQDTADYELPDTIGGRRAGVQSTFGKLKTSLDDTDKRGLVNCYRGEERSAEVGSEGSRKAEGLNDSTTQVTRNIRIERWTSSLFHR